MGVITAIVRDDEGCQILAEVDNRKQLLRLLKGCVSNVILDMVPQILFDRLKEVIKAKPEEMADFSWPDPSSFLLRYI